MARGERSENHPARNMTRENWRGTGNWQVTSTAGTLHSSAQDVNERGIGLEHTAWEKGGRYTAGVEHREPVVGGTEYHSYEAGPFRTPTRAQIASESLGRRVGKGKAGEYHQGTEYMSHAEQAYKGR